MVISASNTPIRRLQQAFSLIELAVVLAIFGGIASMSLVVGTKWMAKEEITATQRNLTTIEMALQTYVNAYGRLPCPGNLTLTPTSASYGLEAFEAGETDGTCTGAGTINATAAGTVSYGSVPAKTLGLPNAAMRDQWGSLIVYYVTNSHTQKGSYWNSPTAHSNYKLLNSNGAIRVNDTTGTANAITTAAVYALVSHGKNKHGGYQPNGARIAVSTASADERNNCNCNASAANTGHEATLVSGLQSATFDDFVTFALRRNLGN